MAESSVRSGRKKGFVVLFREVAQDSRLSLEARGLFALMVSLPDDWEYTVSGLAVKAGCGREKVRRLLKELQRVGYLIREQSHREGGKFGGNVYVLQDEAPPLPENPSNGIAKKEPLPRNTVNGENRQREKPLTDIRPQQNKDLTEEENNIPPKAPKGGKRISKYDLAEEAKPILRAYVGEDRELAASLGALIEVRVAKKAINSGRAIAMLLCELDKLSHGQREEKLQIVRQSVTNSWKGVFPLKGSDRKECFPIEDGKSARVREEEGTYLL
ncbi:MAG: helix-turn-helix domain-containing protein [Lawsonibacter sp.]|jgi:hypothetical protein